MRAYRGLATYCAAMLLPALLAGAPAACAAQHDFDASLDVRAVSVTTNQRSFLDNGGGKLRFDAQRDGLRLGSLRLGYRGDLTETVRITAEAFAYGDHDRQTIDLTELIASWRPVPASLFRHELKLGAFYPAISLEHRMRGWRSPYSLSASAINTWVGEELRTIGLEYNLDWLGQQQGSAWNLGFNAAVYGFNDPAGVIIARRGWALHDRQTTLFGRLGQPGIGAPFGPGHGPADGRTLFHRDIDGKPGYYAGISINHRGLVELRALRYDNRGDPTVQAPEINDAAWKTEFNSLGLRITPDDNWTLMWQRLQGRTYVNAGGAPTSSCWLFDANYVLASWTRGKHRLTARYDDFNMRQTVTTFFFRNYDRGSAVLYAWLYDFRPHLTLVAESLDVNSRLAFRGNIGAPISGRERQLQLGLRLEL